MKTMSMERQIELIRKVFYQYVEIIAASYMSGEIPSSYFAIHTRGTKDNDWLAYVRFKNMPTISVFRCEVWMEDIVRLCNRCRIYLITEPIYELVSFYFMLHPFLQIQSIQNAFTSTSSSGYESMLVEAGAMTYQYIKRCYAFPARDEQEPVLELLNYHNMIFTNIPHGPDKNRVREAMLQEWEWYQSVMRRKYSIQYRMAKKFRSSVSRVDSDGFIHLCRIPQPVIIRNNTRDDYIREVLKTKAEPDISSPVASQKKLKKQFSVNSTRHCVTDVVHTVDTDGFYRISKRMED